MLVSTLTAMLALAGSLSSAAQTLVPPRPPSPTPRRDSAARTQSGADGTSLLPPRTKNPYGRLFDPFRPSPQPLADGSAARKTVCGLTIWNVTPDADPRMVLRPGNDQADHKIKRIAPPVCAE